MGWEDHANTPSVNLKISSKRSPLESLNRKKKSFLRSEGKKMLQQIPVPNEL